MSLHGADQMRHHPNLPPPRVAVARQHARHRDWAFQVLGLCGVIALCYYGEQVLVVVLASVLVAFVLAPLVDLFLRWHLPRWVSALLAVSLLMAALGGLSLYGVNQASNLVDQLPRYTVKVREKITKLMRKTQKLEGLTLEEARSGPKAHESSPSLIELSPAALDRPRKSCLPDPSFPFWSFAC